MDETTQPLQSMTFNLSPIFSTTELNVDTVMDHENHSHYANETTHEDIIYHPAVQTVFYMVYSTIFSLGIFGNVLVCFVVGRNKAMQTVTNFFITNLALADILLCALAVPFTPLYTFLGEWIFGRALCHLVPYVQGTSVYISTLTLTSIAIDRFFVIIYPFKPRMKVLTCLLIIVGIWVFALLATLPYGIFLQFNNNYTEKFYCDEAWPSERIRLIFSSFTVTLQFILPFLIMLFCYVKVSLKLSDRMRSKPGSKNSKKEAMERDRKRRTNRMLIAMVFIFGMSWLPLNFFNFHYDLSVEAEQWKYSNLLFFIVHAVAMSSTCYNPFLYAWLNENFRKEFKQVLPCFKPPTQNLDRSRYLSQRTTCNGAETVQESMLATTSQPGSINASSTPNNQHTALETIEEVNSSSVTAPSGGSNEIKLLGSALYHAETNEVIVHFPSPSFLSTSPITGKASAGAGALPKPGGDAEDNVCEGADDADNDDDENDEEDEDIIVISPENNNKRGVEIKKPTGKSDIMTSGLTVIVEKHIAPVRTTSPENDYENADDQNDNDNDNQNKDNGEEDNDKILLATTDQCQGGGAHAEINSNISKNEKKFVFSKTDQNKEGYLEA